MQFWKRIQTQNFNICKISVVILETQKYFELFSEENRVLRPLFEARKWKGRKNMKEKQKKKKPV